MKLRPALYIDKDGTLLENEYPDYFSDFKFKEKVIQLIKDFKSKDNYYLFLISNQPDIMLGKVKYSHFLRYMSNFLRVLKNNYNLEFDDIFICLHHEKAKSKKWRKCNCRKPKIGLIEQSLIKYENIDLKNSIIIGDTWRDRDLAKNLNLKFICIK